MAFPRWRFTELLLESCGISEEQIHGHWRRRWLKVAEAVSSPSTDRPDDAASGDDPGAAVDQECRECGALVLNPFRHQEWHAAH